MNHRDELVASTTPATNTALTAGHQLYTAEMTVARLKEQLNQFHAPKLRARYANRLQAAAAHRDTLNARYQAALAAVTAANPATAEHVEDAVWRAYLVEEA